MQKLKAGFIGFIPFTAKGEEYYKLLEDYGKLGYKGVEQANALLEGDFDANLARIKGYGLEPICVPLMKMPGMPEPDIDDLVAKAHKLGVTRLVTYMSVAANYRFGMGQGTPSYDEVMTQIEEFERTATRAKAEGLQFMFHNHDAEFTTVVNGETPFELIDQEHREPHLRAGCGLGHLRRRGSRQPDSSSGQAHRRPAHQGLRPRQG